MIADYLDGLSTDHLYIIGPFFQGVLPLTTALVFVDRGADFRSGDVGFSVGDGDSASVLLDEKLSPTKDFSDLAYVFQHIPDKIRHISLLGFLGGRRDHELMNLAESHRLLVQKPGLSVDFDGKVLGFSAGSRHFSVHGTFSVFAFEKVSLSLMGDCQYPIQGIFQELSSHGLSNEGSGEMILNSDGPVFVFL